MITIATRGAVAAATGPFVISRPAEAAGAKPLVIAYGVPRATMDPQNHLNTYDESPLGNVFENLIDMSNPIDPYKGWTPMLARVDPNFKPFSVTWHAYDPIDRAGPVDRYTVNIIEWTSPS